MLEQPFFIVGSGRCGSTRLHDLLRDHPRVVLTNEAGVVELVHGFWRMTQLVNRTSEPAVFDDSVTLHGALNESYQSGFATIATPHFAAMLLEFYASLAEDEGVTHWGDKLPDATAAMALRQVFSQTRFIVMVRDPRDTWCSWRAFWKKRPNLETMSVRDFASGWANLYGQLTTRLEDGHWLRYEDLIADERGTIENVLAYLDLPWVDTIGRAVDGSQRFATHGTSASPIASVARWRTEIGADERTTIEEECADCMAALGYPA